jgi:hypothetical protein
MADTGATILFWTAVTAVAALLSAGAAALSAWFGYVLIRAQAEPKVIVYTCADPDRQTILMIRIANIGRDVATDVAFTPSRPIPARAFGLSESGPEPPTTEVMTDGPLIAGIPVLGPGDIRDTTWGQIGGLLKTVGRTPIDISFTYRHGRRTLTGSSRLEVASFIGTDASGNPAESAARSLERIADAAERAARRPGPSEIELP